MKCEHSHRFRRCRFERGRWSIEAYVPDHLVRLGHDYTITGHEGLWTVRAMDADHLCETVLRKKAEERPRLYPIAEIASG